MLLHIRKVKFVKYNYEAIALLATGIRRPGRFNDVHRLPAQRRRCFISDVPDTRTKRKGADATWVRRQVVEGRDRSATCLTQDIDPEMELFTEALSQPKF